MPRFAIWYGSLLLACSLAGCCYPGSPHCQLNYPNMIGFTYPNWCPPPLVTPPNGPTDEEIEADLKQRTPQAAWQDSPSVVVPSVAAPATVERISPIGT
jgi:hypothetical protein